MSKMAYTIAFTHGAGPFGHAFSLPLNQTLATQYRLFQKVRP